MNKPDSNKTKPSQKQTAQKFGLTTKRSEDFSDWYTQVCTKCDLIDQYSIRGCYIMKPSACYMWRQIQEFINISISKMGVKEVYFPMLISKKNLEKEKSHIDNFQPEVAWVTRSGDTDIEPLAVRPTSETIIYPYFSKWIRSHRDLPMKVNQWCNILRWEIKSTVPFIRGREFLWQEGHCAYQTKEECDLEVSAILDLYEKVYSDLLAVPVIKGKKSENEKFGGADYTLTVESFIKGSGRAVQAATSHSLGTNFSKMFDVKADDFVFQSSWGLTTRSLGVSVMIHSDDIGLVLPPKVAMVQVVIIGCGKLNEEVKNYIKEIKNNLEKEDIRVEFDDRDNVNAGYKFNYWEMRGVPLRIEIGPKDYKENKMIGVQRNKLIKETIQNIEIGFQIKTILEKIHIEMYEKAKDELEKSIKKVKNWSEFSQEINKNNICLISWCNTIECEEKIKEESAVYNENKEVVVMGAKSLCIPFKWQENIGLCLKCGQEGKCIALFGKSY